MKGKREDSGWTSWVSSDHKGNAGDNVIGKIIGIISAVAILIILFFVSDMREIQSWLFKDMTPLRWISFVVFCSLPLFLVAVVIRIRLNFIRCKGCGMNVNPKNMYANPEREGPYCRACCINFSR